MPAKHYENFPVASFALPAHLRRPVETIYAFARSADDIADEGEAPAQQRLADLQRYLDALDVIENGKTPESGLFADVAQVIRKHALPIQPFRDLISAFKQDVSQTRYASFGEVMDYCRRSANPVGRLLMALYQDADPRHLAYADSLCSSLQLINFLQDVQIDFQKDRIYLSQDELAQAGIGEAGLKTLLATPGKPAVAAGAGFGGIAIGTPRSTLETRWQPFMLAQIERTRKMLQAAAPLGLVLPGRIGFETRMIIVGGERILRKLYLDPPASLRYRVKLNAWDWTVIITRALLKK